MLTINFQFNALQFTNALPYIYIQVKGIGPVTKSETFVFALTSVINVCFVLNTIAKSFICSATSCCVVCLLNALPLIHWLKGEL